MRIFGQEKQSRWWGAKLNLLKGQREPAAPVVMG